MVEFIEQALKSPAGSFGFVFALLVLAFYATWQVSRWTAKLSHVDKLDGNIVSIKEDISTIKAFINVYQTSNNPFDRAQSPLSLTEKGVELAKDINVDALISNHWIAIEKDLSTALKKDCNPYDIQQESINVANNISKYLTDKEMDSLKLYAYRNGHTITTYNLLIAVYIRDAYFKKHAIDLSEVDKYDPHKTSK